MAKNLWVLNLDLFLTEEAFFAADAVPLNYQAEKNHFTAIEKLEEFLAKAQAAGDEVIFASALQPEIIQSYLRLLQEPSRVNKLTFEKTSDIHLCKIAGSSRGIKYFVSHTRPDSRGALANIINYDQAVNLIYQEADKKDLPAFRSNTVVVNSLDSLSASVDKKSASQTPVPHAIEAAAEKPTDPKLDALFAELDKKFHQKHPHSKEKNTVSQEINDKTKTIGELLNSGEVEAKKAIDIIQGIIFGEEKVLDAGVVSTLSKTKKEILNAIEDVYDGKANFTSAIARIASIASASKENVLEISEALLNYNKESHDRIFIVQQQIIDNSKISADANYCKRILVKNAENQWEPHFITQDQQAVVNVLKRYHASKCSASAALDNIRRVSLGQLDDPNKHLSGLEKIEQAAKGDHRDYVKGHLPPAIEKHLPLENFSYSPLSENLWSDSNTAEIDVTGVKPRLSPQAPEFKKAIKQALKENKKNPDEKAKILAFEKGYKKYHAVLEQKFRYDAMQETQAALLENKEQPTATKYNEELVSFLNKNKTIIPAEKFERLLPKESIDPKASSSEVPPTGFGRVKKFFSKLFYKQPVAKKILPNLDDKFDPLQRYEETSKILDDFIESRLKDKSISAGILFSGDPNREAANTLVERESERIDKQAQKIKDKNDEIDKAVEEAKNFRLQLDIAHLQRLLAPENLKITNTQTRIAFMRKNKDIVDVLTRLRENPEFIKDNADRQRIEQLKRLYKEWFQANLDKVKKRTIDEMSQDGIEMGATGFGLLSGVPAAILFGLSFKFPFLKPIAVALGNLSWGSFVATIIATYRMAEQRTYHHEPTPKEVASLALDYIMFVLNLAFSPVLNLVTRGAPFLLKKIVHWVNPLFNNAFSNFFPDGFHADDVLESVLEMPEYQDHYKKNHPSMSSFSALRDLLAQTNVATDVIEQVEDLKRQAIAPEQSPAPESGRASSFVFWSKSKEASKPLLQAEKSYHAEILTWEWPSVWRRNATNQHEAVNTALFKYRSLRADLTAYHKDGHPIAYQYRKELLEALAQATLDFRKSIKVQHYDDILAVEKLQAYVGNDLATLAKHANEEVIVVGHKSR